MPTFGTFGGELPEPTKAIADARTDFQLEKLKEIVQPMMDEAIARIELQEIGLEEVYKPLTREARQRIATQQKELDAIKQQLLIAASTLTTTQNIETRSLTTRCFTVSGEWDPQTVIYLDQEPTVASLCIYQQNCQLVRYNGMEYPIQNCVPGDEFSILEGKPINQPFPIYQSPYLAKFPDKTDEFRLARSAKLTSLENPSEVTTDESGETSFDGDSEQFRLPPLPPVIRTSDTGKTAENEVRESTTYETETNGLPPITAVECTGTSVVPYFPTTQELACIKSSTHFLAVKNAQIGAMVFKGRDVPIPEVGAVTHDGKQIRQSGPTSSVGNLTFLARLNNGQKQWITYSRNLSPMFEPDLAKVGATEFWGPFGDATFFQREVIFNTGFPTYGGPIKAGTGIPPEEPIEELPPPVELNGQPPPNDNDKPIPESCPADPVIKCPLPKIPVVVRELPAAPEGSAPIGSYAFCSHVLAIATWFERNATDIQNELYQYLYKAGQKPILPLIGTIPVVGRTLATMINAFNNEQHDAMVMRALTIWKDFATSLGAKRPQALQAAWQVKAIIRALESVTVGFAVPVWIQANLSIELGQIGIVIDYVINYLWPTKIITAPEVDSLVLRGYLTEGHAKCLWEMQGEIPELRNHLVRSSRAQVTELEILSLFRRGLINPEQFLSRLRERGWMETENVSELVETSKFIPPISDLIRFAVKDVFDPAKLGKAEMEVEFRQQVGLLQAFKAQGIEPLSIKDFPGAKNGIFDVPLAYWLASYDEQSPTQVFEQLHRLRPNRVNRYKLPNVDGSFTTPQPVTMREVRSLLKERDLNPIWRDRLAAISYRPLGRIDVRRIYETGGFGNPAGISGFGGPLDNPIARGSAELELWEQYQDQGYTPNDAMLQARFTAAEYDRKKHGKATARLIAQVLEQYELGILNNQQATQLLTPLLGSPDSATRQLGSIDAKVATRRVKVVIAATKKQFYDGVIDATGARELLNRSGIAPNRIASYIAEWEILLASKFKEVTSQQLCQWLGSGLISVQTMDRRLRTIGYETQDARRIIDHCLIGIGAKRQAELNRQAKAAAAAAEKQQRAIERARKEEIDSEREALRKFLAGRSDKNLLAWMKEQIITEDDVRRTLALRGMPEEDIDRWVYVALEKING